jgi:hypothetical protein
MPQELLEQMPSATMFDDLAKKSPAWGWVRWIQSLADLISRPVLNRVTASTSATAVALNGSPQSTSIGTGAITPKRYAEVWVSARVTFNISAGGVLRVSVYRTTGAVPANGAAPNGGDVIVAGDSFAGPATIAGQNMSGSLSFIDTGLDVTKAYKYYFAFTGTNALTGNLVNTSSLQVSEF